MTWPPGLVIAVLAAGLGARFGGDKLDHDCAGRKLGRWALDTALSTGAPVLVVTGPQEPAFLADALPRPARRIVNAAPSDGMGGSVALAAQAAQAMRASHLLILLADMPLVGVDLLEELASRACAHGVAATRHADGRPGAPACFAAERFNDLAALSGQAGARAMLAHVPDSALVAPAGDALLDVDYRSDVARLAALLSKSR